MSPDVASLAVKMTSYVSAVGAYDGTVLAKLRDEAADATVGLGRRILQQVFGSRGEGEPPVYQSVPSAKARSLTRYDL